MRVLVMALAALVFTVAGVWGVSSFAAEKDAAAVMEPVVRHDDRTRTAQEDSFAQLEWLAGCWRWQSASGAVTGDEQWMAAAGGLMMGMSRVMRGGRVVEHEFLRIVERDGVLHYVANPSGQTETVFSASTVSDTMAVFENPQHDFPQRISYRRQGGDSLVATISAFAEGTRRPIAFRMARVSCP